MGFSAFFTSIGLWKSRGQLTYFSQRFAMVETKLRLATRAPPPNLSRGLMAIAVRPLFVSALSPCKTGACADSLAKKAYRCLSIPIVFPTTDSFIYPFKTNNKGIIDDTLIILSYYSLYHIKKSSFCGKIYRQNKLT